MKLNQKFLDLISMHRYTLKIILIPLVAISISFVLFSMNASGIDFMALLVMSSFVLYWTSKLISGLLDCYGEWYDKKFGTGE